MGRPRIPTAIQESKGAFKKDPQRRRLGEPVAPSSRPKMPTKLGRYGTACWRETVSFLEELKVLSKVDKKDLELFSRAYNRYRIAENDIEKHGVVQRGTLPSGAEFARKNPALNVIKDAEAVMMRLASEFGLSPSSRTRLSVQVEEKQDPLVALFEARKPRN